MLIFWDQRLVFLATPKAGSSAVEAALESLAAVTMPRPAPLKHMTAAAYRTHLAPYLEAVTGDHFTTVALMREPLSWMRSWYRFRLRDDFEDPTHAMEGRSFERFVQDYMSEARPPHADIGCQSDYLTDSTGAPAADRIFRYEEIDRFVQFLEDRLDCAIMLPRVNVPPAVDIRLGPETEADLRSVLTRDFRLYEGLA